MPDTSLSLLSPLSPLCRTPGWGHSRTQGLLFLLTGLLFACGGGGGNSASQLAATDVTGAFSVQGSVSVVAGNLIDSDINNPASQNIANNTPASAQALPSFVVVGGYANQPMQGASGPLFSSGDTSDYFSLYLHAGQSIQLDIHNSDTADLDLYLLNATGGSVLDTSLSVTSTETLQVTSSGYYQILVQAVSGASSYTLRTIQTTAVTTTGFRLSDAFAPNELIVKYRQSQGYLNHLGNPRSPLRRMGLNRLAGSPDYPLRLQLQQGALPQRRGILEPAMADNLALSEQFSFVSEQARAKYATLLAIKAMQNDPEVLYAEPNMLISASATPNDLRYLEQWNLPFISLPAAWDQSTGSDTVIVAVIDSGVLGGHPDLSANLVAGYDFIADVSNANDGDGLDANPEDSGSSFHGTHVAGIIAAVSNNRTGVSGATWHTSIMPLRVLGQSGGNTYDAAQAIRYAAGLPNDSGTLPAQAADIINLSLGGAGSCTSTYHDLLAEVRARDILVVAAAGNDGSSTGLFSPANCNDVISVGSVGQDYLRAPYSNYGNTLDLVAPGGRDDTDEDSNGKVDSILSLSATTLGSGALSYTYSYRFGTSMAAPHVSAVLALILAVNPALSADNIEQMLISGLLTDDLGSTGKDNEFGYGLINAEKAVAAAVNSLSGDPVLSSYLDSSLSSVEFIPSLSTTQFETRTLGDDPVTITGINYSAAWLDLESLGQNAGVETWRLRADRSGLDAGLYSDTISFTTSTNTVNIDIVLQVNPPDQTYELGPLGISLINAGNGSTVRTAILNSLGSSYNIDFSNLAQGNYRLRIASDLNGQGSNDSGEAYLESSDFEVSGNTTLDALLLQWGAPD